MRFKRNMRKDEKKERIGREKEGGKEEETVTTMETPNHFNAQSSLAMQ